MSANVIKRSLLVLLGFALQGIACGILVRCATSEPKASQSLVDAPDDNGSAPQNQARQQADGGAAVGGNSQGVNNSNSDTAANGVENFSAAGDEASAGLENSDSINNVPIDSAPLSNDGNSPGSSQTAGSSAGNLPSAANSVPGAQVNLGVTTNHNSTNEGLTSPAGQVTPASSNGTAAVNAASEPNKVGNQAASAALGSPHGVVSWVGYDYKRDAKRLDVQIVTEGSPTYRIFKEKNRAGQSELVVRYLNTELRSKIRRDIDASEFRSPVAYVRMRHDVSFNHTDVVMTLRDPVEPTLVNKGSSLMFTFLIPERWFAPTAQEVPVASAELTKDAPAGLSALTDGEKSDQSPVYVDNPGADKFGGLDSRTGAKLVPKSEGDKELVPAVTEPQTNNPAPVNSKPAEPSDTQQDLLENRPQNADYNEFTYVVNAVAQGDFSSDIPSPNSTGDLLEDVPVDLTAANAAAEAKPAVPQPNQQPAPSGAQPAGTDVLGVDAGTGAVPASSKKVMRLDFREAPVSQVIKMIAAESNINFIISPEAGNKTTSISLKNVPWDVALKAVLDSNRLGMQEIAPSLVRIDFLDNFAKDHEAAERARQATEALVPTKVLVMPLNYLKADAAAAIAKEMMPKADPGNLTQQRSVSRFRVQAENRTNSLVVEATPSVLSTIKTLLEKLDTQTPQVRIQSRLVEFTKNFDDGLGVTWNAPLNIDAGRGLGFGSLPFPNSLNSNFAVDPGGAKVAGGSAAFKLGSINNFLALDLRIRAYESKKMAETLQTQDVVVQDNEQASIIAGSEDFLPGTAGVGGTAAPTPVSYNLSLNVTPHITADGTVQMKLEIHGDSPKDAAGSSLLSRNTRSLSTTLLKRSGETAVIGGLYSSEIKDTTLGVPILSRIPLIGALFRSRDKTDSKKDLLIMVTPTILGAGSASTGGANGASLVPSMDGGGGRAPSDFGQSQSGVQGANTQQGQSAQSQNANGQSAQSSNASLQSNVSE